MKKIAFIYFLVSSLTVNAEDVGTHSHILAEKLYKEQLYDSAAKVYHSMMDENTVSPVLFYNIGNCYYKSGDPVSAILFYEKCLKYDPSNEDAKANIEFIRTKINNHVDVKRTGLSGWFYTLANSKGNNYWTWMTILLINFGFISFIVLRFVKTHNLKNIISISGVVALFLGCFTLYVAWFQKNSMTAENKAIIFATEAEIKSSPSENSTTVLILKAGAKVSITGENENWVEIEVDDANKGWISKEELKTI